MGQPFPEQVAPGGVLIFPQIQSPNFSIAAQTGWAIMSNGDAYFFDLVLNGGTIIGPDWVLNPSGFFMYGN